MNLQQTKAEDCVPSAGAKTRPQNLPAFPMAMGFWATLAAAKSAAASPLGI